MRFKGLLRLCGAAGALAAAAWGGVIKDPQMGLDSDGFSDPLTRSSVFSPNNGGGIFQFYNATGSQIVGLTFGTDILPGLSQQIVANNFSCNSQSTNALPNPFFKNCAIDYTPASGLLTISFFGVNPLDRDSRPETEAGEHEGIPPLPPGCGLTPDLGGCANIGHFLITLNNNFATTGAAGGWSADSNPALFSTNPVFGVLDIQTAPEPAPALLVLGALAGLAWFARRRTVSR
jgi:hypothetical protein